MIQLMHGDCLELMQKIPDQSVDMVMCDLPYGTTACKWDTVLDLSRLWTEYRRVCTGAIVLTSDQPFTSALIMSNADQFRYTWTWIKTYTTGFMNANKMPLKNTEDICVFYKNLPPYNPQGVISVEKKQTRKKDKTSTIYNNMGLKDGEYVQKFSNYPRQTIECGKVPNTVHPTQKPVQLMEYLIKTYTNGGMTVLDNCMGSGTTGVACVNTNRNFIGIERDDTYFKICEQRIYDAELKVEADKIESLFGEAVTC